MATFQQETLAQAWPEAERLFALHYEELTFGKERIKLAPDTEKYKSLERDGALVVYTAREEGRLVGYAVFFVVAGHAHYKDNTFAVNDVFFLDPEHRKNRWLGYKFLRYIDADLCAAINIDAIKWHVKVRLNWGEMLRRMGYEEEEVVWSKISPQTSQAGRVPG